MIPKSGHRFSEKTMLGHAAGGRERDLSEGRAPDYGST
jgi:hypothetical protein